MNWTFSPSRKMLPRCEARLVILRVVPEWADIETRKTIARAGISFIFYALSKKKNAANTCNGEGTRVADARSTVNAAALSRLPALKTGAALRVPQSPRLRVLALDKEKCETQRRQDREAIFTVSG
jgi:hypothetical protein